MNVQRYPSVLTAALAGGFLAATVVFAPGVFAAPADPVACDRARVAVDELTRDLNRRDGRDGRDGRGDDDRDLAERLAAERLVTTTAAEVARLQAIPEADRPEDFAAQLAAAQTAATNAVAAAARFNRDRDRDRDRGDRFDNDRRDHGRDGDRQRRLDDAIRHRDLVCVDVTVNVTTPAPPASPAVVVVPSPVQQFQIQRVPVGSVDTGTA